MAVQVEPVAWAQHTSVVAQSALVVQVLTGGFVVQSLGQFCAVS